MSGITEFGYARFGVSDLAAWRAMATDLLGLEVFEEDASGGKLFLRTDLWHHRIILEEDASDDLIGAGLRVAGADEFQEMQERLSAASIPFEVGSAEMAAGRFVQEIMTLRDPGDNPLEIFHGPRVDAHKPFYPGRRMFGKFVTGDGGVGHMILRHKGLRKSYEFYKLLGMRGGIEYKIPAGDNKTADIMFMHCNSRDHSVAFGPASEKSANHLMIEVDNLDDVFMTHELVQASPYPVIVNMGKHANDAMFSFYFKTPSGWLIEVGYAGRPATHQSEYYVRDTYGHSVAAGDGLGLTLD